MTLRHGNTETERVFFQEAPEKYRQAGCIETAENADR